MDEKIIQLERAVHHKQFCLMIRFGYDSILKQLVKQLDGVLWSNTLKSWYVNDTEENLSKINTLFNPIAKIDKTLLFPIPPIINLSKETLEKITDFTLWLKSKRYSPSTIKTYTDAIKSFLKFYANKPISEITNQDVIKFNNEYILANNYSASFQNQIVNAIKLFFKTIQNKVLDIELIHRPKRPKLLPNVLSKEEVKSILSALTNNKHITMLSVIYACGLRRSELINLKPTHVDSARKLLIIKQSKGRKDRIVPISDKLIEMLRNYYLEFKPKTWLFEGQLENTKYSERSLEEVLKKSVRLAGINKPVSLLVTP